MSPDCGAGLFVSGANALFETYYNRRLFVVPAAGGAARRWSARIRRSMSSARSGRPTASRSFFPANIGVHEELFVVRRGGRQAAPVDRRRSTTSGGVGRGRQARRVHDQRFDVGRRRVDAAAADDTRAEDHARVRLPRARLQAAAQRSDPVEGRRRRHGRGRALLSGGLQAGPAAIRSPCRRTADRRPPTSSGSARSAYEIQVLAGKGLRRACSRTIAAAPDTATRSCATWSATTSRTRTSTSWPASTK